MKRVGVLTLVIGLVHPGAERFFRDRGIAR
jgi:hypothetical protein